jgi:poly-gamma-glutamate synthesis protein (capsule biosynthesis protein)
MLAAVEAWSDTVGSMLSRMNAQGPAANWRLLPVENPSAALAAGLAQAALTMEGDGPPVITRTLALAVPWTSRWEAVTSTEAEAIVRNGHSLARVMNWEEMEPGLRPLKVDDYSPADPAYPLNEYRWIQSTPNYAAEARELATVLRAAGASQPLVLLAAVGDIMLDRGLGVAIGRGDLDYPFAAVSSVLQSADLTVGNLESALGDQGSAATKSYTFRAPPAAAGALAVGGVDVLSLANNHAMDYGAEALIQGIQLLSAEGIVAVGAGANLGQARAPTVVAVRGLRLAFLAYVNVPVEGGGFDTRSWEATDLSPGIAWADPEVIRADVAAARSLADQVIVLLHSGYEYVEAPSEPQMAAARAAVDAGASLVLGHHSHVLQGIEFHGRAAIVYGLGNFAFQIDGPAETGVVNVWLDLQGVRQIELLPAMVQNTGQPRWATPAEADQTRAHVYRLTDLLNAR